MENLTRNAALAAILTLFSSACTTASPNPDGEEAESESEGQEDCDDEIACTEDQQLGSDCQHYPLHGRCGQGMLCDPEADCIEVDPCGSASDCQDFGPCTVASCDTATAACHYENLDADGDGYLPIGCGGADCDDRSSDVYPGQRLVSDCYPDPSRCVRECTTEGSWSPCQCFDNQSDEDRTPAGSCVNFCDPSGPQDL